MQMCVPSLLSVLTLVISIAPSVPDTTVHGTTGPNTPQERGGGAGERGGGEQEPGKLSKTERLG